MPPPAAVVLDVNETLFGLDPVRARLVAGGLPGHTLDVWFARVLRDGFAVAAAGGLAGFRDLATHHVEEVARAAGISTDGLADEVLAGFGEVAVHDDVAAALGALRDAGVRIATLTNGTAAITRGVLERAGLLDAVEATLQVADAGVWKPAPAAYRYAAEVLDLPLERLAMVAAHPWDVHGGARAGMTGAWVDRDGATWPPYLAPPDVTAPTLDGVVARLLEA